MSLDFFTDLITGTQVTGLLTNIGIVFAGIVAIMIVLSPAFLLKGGLSWVTSKITGLFSSHR